MDDKNSEHRKEILNETRSLNDFTRMAEDYRLQGRYEEAIDICRKGLRGNPETLRGRVILGECYLEKGMIAEAKRELEKVAESIEECLSVYKLLSQVYLQEKNMDQASKVIRKALSLSPGEGKKKEKLTSSEVVLPDQKINAISIPAEPGIREESDGHEKAFGEDLTRQVIQTDTLADIYSKQGHLEKALSIYKEILTRQPGNTHIQEKYEILCKQLAAQCKTALYQKMILELERWLAVVAPEENPLSP